MGKANAQFFYFSLAIQQGGAKIGSMNATLLRLCEAALLDILLGALLLSVYWPRSPGVARWTLRLVVTAGLFLAFWLTGINIPQLTFLLALPLVMGLEMVFSRHASSAAFASEDRLQAAYVFLKHLMAVLTMVLLVYTGWINWKVSWGPTHWHWPLWLQGITAVVVLDFKNYLVHRGQHHFSWWWKIHRVHHFTTHLTVYAAARAHLGEYIVIRYFNILVATLCGLDGAALLVAVSAHIVADIFAHADVDFPRKRMPFWAYIIITPNAHALHHSRSHDRENYGALLMIWDVLFGCFRTPTQLSRGDILNFGSYDQRASDGFITDQLLATPPP